MNMTSSTDFSYFPDRVGVPELFRVLSREYAVVLFTIVISKIDGQFSLDLSEKL